MKKIVALAVLVITVLGALTCLTKVPVGYVGMVYSTNGIQSEPLQQGWHLLAPYKK